MRGFPPMTGAIRAAPEGKSRRRLFSTFPAVALDHDAVAIGVLEGPPPLIPVGIERCDLPEAGRRHPGTGRLPFLHRRDVENDQVLDRRRRIDRVPARMGELEVPGGTVGLEHDAVESVVIGKLACNPQPETESVHLRRPSRVANRTGNPQVGSHGSIVRERAAVSRRPSTFVATTRVAVLVSGARQG